jgi:uncharacterized membrane protein YagU involved in acid resistance
MELLPIDLTGLVATILGISIVLIPVIGLTARFALKPTVEALSRLFDHKGLDETVQILERRIALQEHQIDNLEATVRRLDEVADFNRALGSGESDADASEG